VIPCGKSVSIFSPTTVGSSATADSIAARSRCRVLSPVAAAVSRSSTPGATFAPVTRTSSIATSEESRNQSM
jgi:hypothetical protein